MTCLPNNNKKDDNVVKLLKCSERMEIQEKAIYISDWDEMRPWQPVVPVCCYKSNRLRNREKLKEMNKKQKKIVALALTSKQQNTGIYLKPIISQSNSLLPVPRNKLARNMNILSYELPSWRFLVNTKTFEYIDRDHPKDINKVYNLSPRSKSSHKSHCNSRFLDPAAFFDERLSISYKALQLYHPIKFTEVVYNNVTENIPTDIRCRLHTKSFITLPPLPVLPYEGESDGGGGSCKTEKNCTQSKKSPKVTNVKKPVKQGSRNKISCKKKQKKKKKVHLPDREEHSIPQNNTTTANTSIPLLPIEKHLCKVRSNEIIDCHIFPDMKLKKSIFLPKIGNTKSALTKSPSKILILNKEKLVNNPPQMIINDSYLPSLNYGNYESLYKPVQNKSNVTKLPAINGVKVGFSTILR